MWPPGVKEIHVTRDLGSGGGHGLVGVQVFDGCLERMDAHFDGLYSPFGRESIPPTRSCYAP